jgi:hypothetical protein
MPDPPLFRAVTPPGAALYAWTAGAESRALLSGSATFGANLRFFPTRARLNCVPSRRRRSHPTHMFRDVVDAFTRRTRRACQKVEHVISLPEIATEV